MAVVTSLAERIDILESSETGEEIWRISRRLRWRMSTIGKRRNRGRKLGRAGLVSHMGRPPSGALNSFPEEVKRHCCVGGRNTQAGGRSHCAKNWGDTRPLRDRNCLVPLALVAC